MNDLYLKTATEQELIDALPFARGVDENGVDIWVTATHDYALDIIGDVYNKDGVYDANGEVITPPTKVAGFHANLRCNDIVAMLVPQSTIIIPPPNTPTVEFF